MIEVIKEEFSTYETKILLHEEDDNCVLCVIEIEGDLFSFHSIKNRKSLNVIRNKKSIYFDEDIDVLQAIRIFSRQFKS